MNKIFLILILVFSTSLLHGQEDELLEELQELLENLADENEEIVDQDTYFEFLTDIYNDPIDLNKATREELLELGFLTSNEVEAIMEHQRVNGDFIAIYELQSVTGLSYESIKKIRPFVSVNRDLDAINIPLHRLLYEGKHQLFLRYSQILEKQEGYTYSGVNDNGDSTRKYLGDPSKIYLRYRHNFGKKISYGFTAEKDSGEEFFSGSQESGFDFYSAHFFLRDIGPFKHIALGDYGINIGQGLMAWTGLRGGKTSDVMSVKKQRQIVDSYRSVNESKFFRGAALTFGRNDFSVTAFGSARKHDGSVSNISVDEDSLRAGISVLINGGGLHRTESEINKKRIIDSQAGGLSLNYEKDRLAIGLAGIATTFSAPPIPDLPAEIDQSILNSTFLNTSLNYKYLLRNFNFFGETALSGDGDLATLNGLISSLDRTTSLSLVHRYYSPNYFSPYALAFAESSFPSNEHGIYVGMQATPNVKWTINSYADIYNFPASKSSVNAPSQGRDYLFNVKYKPNREWNAYVRVRFELKEKNARENTTLEDFIIWGDKSNFRFHINYKISKSLSLKNRVEYSLYEEDLQPTSRGYMIFQDLSYKLFTSPISISARYTIFNTDDYNSRIYAYENNVLYAYSIPAYYYRGMRVYAVVRYKVVDGIDFWVKYSHTNYANRNSVLSGNDEINGNKINFFTAQLRFMLN